MLLALSMVLAKLVELFMAAQLQIFLGTLVCTYGVVFPSFCLPSMPSY